MNPSSSIVTGGITISAATLEPAVSWALSTAFHVPVPESVSVLVAGAIAYAVHGGINFLKSRAASSAQSQQIVQP
jgi:hypothetical protein